MKQITRLMVFRMAGAAALLVGGLNLGAQDRPPQGDSDLDQTRQRLMERRQAEMEDGSGPGERSRRPNAERRLGGANRLRSPRDDQGAEPMPRARSFAERRQNDFRGPPWQQGDRRQGNRGQDRRFGPPGDQQRDFAFGPRFGGRGRGPMGPPPMMGGRGPGFRQFGPPGGDFPPFPPRQGMRDGFRGPPDQQDGRPPLRGNRRGFRDNRPQFPPDFGPGNNGGPGIRGGRGGQGGPPPMLDRGGRGPRGDDYRGRDFQRPGRQGGRPGARELPEGQDGPPPR